MGLTERLNKFLLPVPADVALSGLETETEYRERWTSIRIIYFTMFLMSLGFSIILTGVWPYLDKLDPVAGKEFMGYVVAANPFAQMLFSPVVGWWSNRLRSIRVPLLFSLSLFSVASLIYSSLELFTEHRKYWMLLSRFLVGVSSASIAACRAYLSAATKLTERTAAVSMISLAQVLGFVVGPALQAAVVPLGEQGVKWGVLKMDMYTAAGWINVVLGFINVILFLPGVFKERRIAAREAMMLQGKCTEEATWKASKPDYLSCWTLIVAFFVLVFNFMLLETLGTSLTMDQFAWSKSEALYYMGVLMSVGAVAACVTFVGIGPLCRRFPERHVMLWGGFLLMVLGRALYIPWGDAPPKIYDSTLKTSPAVAIFYNSTSLSDFSNVSSTFLPLYESASLGGVGGALNLPEIYPDGFAESDGALEEAVTTENIISFSGGNSSLAEENESILLRRKRRSEPESPDLDVSVRVEESVGLEEAQKVKAVLKGAESLQALGRNTSEIAKRAPEQNLATTTGAKAFEGAVVNKKGLQEPAGAIRALQGLQKPSSNEEVSTKSSQRAPEQNLAVLPKVGSVKGAQSQKVGIEGPQNVQEVSTKVEIAPESLPVENLTALTGAKLLEGAHNNKGGLGKLFGALQHQGLQNVQDAPSKLETEKIAPEKAPTSSNLTANKNENHTQYGAQSKEDQLGCPSSQLWCSYTPAMTLTQFILGYALTVVGYPIGVTLIQTIFSKVLGPRPQGVWMGLMTGSGCLSRVMGPVFVSYIYTELGTIWTFGMTTVMMAVSMGWLFIMLDRFRPVEEPVSGPNVAEMDPKNPTDTRTDDTELQQLNKVNVENCSYNSNVT